MRFSPAIGAAGVAAVLAGGVGIRASQGFPPLSELPSTPFSLQDAAMASSGLRAVGADLAWIQLLQYAAGGLPELTDDPSRPYDHLSTLALRVARLDPSFHRAYLFGASMLAWFNNIQRTDEAVALLKEGMRRDPGQPLYSVYIAALAYRNRGEADKMIAILEPTLGDPNSPIEMKAIIANLYKTRGEYSRALILWEQMLEHESERREWPRARVQIAEIHDLMKKGR